MQDSDDFNFITGDYPIENDAFTGNKAVQTFGDFLVILAQGRIIDDVLTEPYQHFVIQVGLPFRPCFYGVIPDG